MLLYIMKNGLDEFFWMEIRMFLNDADQAFFGVKFVSEVFCIGNSVRVEKNP